MPYTPEVLVAGAIGAVVFLVGVLYLKAKATRTRTRGLGRRVASEPANLRFTCAGCAGQFTHSRRTLAAQKRGTRKFFCKACHTRVERGAAGRERRMTDLRLLDNIAWNTLTGTHARNATGAGGARRFAPGFSAILGFADTARPDFDALTPYCEFGEHFYCAVWSGPAPPGWQIDAETTMFQMVWDAPLPTEDAAPDAVPLNVAHVPRMLALAELTKPGPFGPRTIELGEYHGLFDGERLAAMAGERMAAGALREISGVCTHPDFQGRGLARRLMQKLVRREMQRGETPFLHVMRDNHNAQRLYERMGFRRHQEHCVRVLSRRPGGTG